MIANTPNQTNHRTGARPNQRCAPPRWVAPSASTCATVTNEAHLRSLGTSPADLWRRLDEMPATEFVGNMRHMTAERPEGDPIRAVRARRGVRLDRLTVDGGEFVRISASGWTNRRPPPQGADPDGELASQPRDAAASVRYAG